MKRIVIVGDTVEAWMAGGVFARAVGKGGTEVIVLEHQSGALPFALAQPPSIRSLHDRLSFDERDFLAFCRGSFLLGTQLKVPDQKASQIIGYGDVGMPIGLGPLLQDWASLVAARQDVTLGGVTPAVQLAFSGRFRHPPQGPSQLPVHDYGYVVEAERYRYYLKRAALHYGARVASASSVQPDADGGRLLRLNVAGQGRIEADLFVDASGSQRILLSALGKVSLPMPARDERMPSQGLGLIDARLSDEGLTLIRPVQGEAGRSVISIADMQRAVGSDEDDAAWVGNTVGVGAAALSLPDVDTVAARVAAFTVEALVGLLPVSGGEDHGERTEFNRQVAALRVPLVDRIAALTVNERAAAGALPPTLERRLSQFQARGRVVTLDHDSYEATDWAQFFAALGLKPRRGNSQLSPDASLEGLRQAFDRLAVHVLDNSRGAPDHLEYLKAARVWSGS